ncbi:HIT family protein [Veronia pacifica]|uniref:HIT family protein n=1 Tax=Veronia pacifica TaxID=1080227 RepID=UPI001C301812|nr:HIT domain-containing protein [Veronia pacifica]
MGTLIHDRVEAARNGKNETVVCQTKSGWVVIGDVQFLKGYCLLLADPVVESLNSLTEEDRKQYLYETTVIGDALLDLTGCYRINYETLGNSEPALHTHIFPRYMSEKPEIRRYPAWFYDWENAPKFNRDEMADFANDLKQYLVKAGVAID